MEILLVLFLSLLFPLIIYCITRWLTSEERNFFELPQNRDLLILSQRTAIGFQIVATALHVIPMLKCIEEINHPSSFNDGAQAAVIFIIFPFTLAIFFSGIAYTHCFKYLFYMKSERKAFFILIIPFVTASLIAIVFGGKVIMDIGHTSGSFARNIVIIVASVSMLAITVIFNTQRKRFKHYLSEIKYLKEHGNNRFQYPKFSIFDKKAIFTHEETFLSPFTPNQIDEKMCNLPGYGIPLKLIGRNILQDGFEYSLSCATCFLTWRECMYVKCIQNHAGSTATIFSKNTSPLQIFTWGNREKNIAEIKSILLI